MYACLSFYFVFTEWQIYQFEEEKVPLHDACSLTFWFNMEARLH